MRCLSTLLAVLVLGATLAACTQTGVTNGGSDKAPASRATSILDSGGGGGGGGY